VSESAARCCTPAAAEFYPRRYNLKKTPVVVALMEAGDDDAFTGRDLADQH
jgi:hypothetical protein